jgi:hypothetical protein
MTTALRPMNTGELLDRALKIYRLRFLRCIGIGCLEMAAIFGISFLASLSRNAFLSWNFYTSICYYDLFGFFILVSFPSFVKLTERFLLSKINSTRVIGSSDGVRWSDYLWTAFLSDGAALVVPELFFLGLSAAIRLGGAPGARLSPVSAVSIYGALAAAGALSVWVGVSICFSLPASVVERTAGVNALRRSWRLTKGSRWRIALTCAALICSDLILVIALEYSTGQILRHFFQGRHLGLTGPQIYYVVGPAIQFIAGAAIIPIFPIFLALFYYDQRVRKEGFDLEEMMVSAGLAAPAAVVDPISEAAAASPSEPAALPAWTRVPQQH